MSNSFNRFQKLNKDFALSRDMSNAKFIFAGYPSIKINNEASGACQIAAVVNQQEKDSAYVYTKVNEPLEIGSIWEAKGLHLLISEEIVVIKKVEWRKYIAILCNIEVADTWGWFRGPEETYINIALKENSLIQSQQKPILVLPSNVLKLGDKIMIKGRGWFIQEEDSISTDGISYYSLRAATISKDAIKDNENEEVFVEEKEDLTHTLPEETTSEDGLTIYVNPMTENTIETENGYFKTSTKEIVVSERTSTKVVFSLPFGLDEADITVKQGGELVTYKYIKAEEDND